MRRILKYLYMNYIHLSSSGAHLSLRVQSLWRRGLPLIFRKRSQRSCLEQQILGQPTGWEDGTVDGCGIRSTSINHQFWMVETCWNPMNFEINHQLLCTKNRKHPPHWKKNAGFNQDFQAFLIIFAWATSTVAGSHLLKDHRRNPRNHLWFFCNGGPAFL